MDKCFQPNQTIGHYVASFNADAPPTTARQTQLDAVLVAERHRQAEVLNEGNPLAYFDINLDERQQPAGWSRTTRSLGSTDGLGDSKTTLEAAPESLLRHSSQTARSSYESSSVSPRALNLILHENFIFSRPMEPKTDRDPRKLRPQQMKSNQKDSLRTMTALSTKEHSPSRLDAERAQAEKLCEGDYILLRLPGDEICGEQATESADLHREATAFQLLRSVRSPKAAQEVVARLRSLEQESVGGGGGAKYFVLQMKKFALMPRGSRSKAEEERLQSQQVDGLPNDSNSMSEGLELESNQSADDSTRSLQMGDWTALFASFQEVLASPVATINGSSETGGSELKLSIDMTEKAAPSSERGLSQSNGGSSRAQALAVPAVGTSHLFAVGSVVLSKQEVAQSQCDEPFLSVNALFPSEMEAMSYALSLPPSQSLNNAMLCVLPVGKWLRFEDAHDWCVQVEASRRERQEKRARPSPIAIPAVVPLSPAVSSTKARSIKRAMVAPVVPDWQRDRDEGKRLHHFICARMGAPTRVPEKERVEDSGGFTPKPLTSLEDKLDTLHEYLQAASASVSPTRTGLGSGVAIMKFRHVKRFGFIMRSRIAGGTHASDSDSNAGASSPHPSACASPSGEK
ncbi:hypothetical protein BBJ28_00021418 [Nothophytophthora sp. Chile5]|nr:hypothetical protein BBJ28_00021418 [Nothophytophthora sp. Chile5]